ncbi:hypothetical protein QC763_0094930 [Podospora pseudopauciseta]|uniref:Uncharacterized protein n=1 Tax=Podospora pseudopauciseta TaxID=2093780 RepID=A0ABR0H4Y4_9PEZI|nr:hypothetical protein QC763_0094930 [Podospora pseudopauciseta]
MSPSLLRGHPMPFVCLSTETTAAAAPAGPVATAEGVTRVGGSRTCRPTPNGKRVPSPTSGSGSRPVTMDSVGIVPKIVRPDPS